MAGIFLRSYLEAIKNSLFVPGNEKDLEIMLKTYLFEKAIYELGYELNNRPEWVITPPRGIKDLMEDE